MMLIVWVIGQWLKDPAKSGDMTLHYYFTSPVNRTQESLTSSRTGFLSFLRVIRSSGLRSIIMWPCRNTVNAAVNFFTTRISRVPKLFAIKAKYVKAHPRQSPGTWTIEDWITQNPAPSGQSSVHIPYPFVGFACQMPLLKNNLRRLLSSLLINFVYKHANTRLVTLCMMLPFTKTQL